MLFVEGERKKKENRRGEAVGGAPGVVGETEGAEGE